MRDRSISLSFTQLFAYLLAVAGVALIGTNFFASETNDHLGFVGVPILALAMVLAIRSYLCRLAVLVKETQALLQDAYMVGREVGREETANVVRSLR